MPEIQHTDQEKVVRSLEFILIMKRLSSAVSLQNGFHLRHSPLNHSGDKHGTGPSGWSWIPPG